MHTILFIARNAVTVMATAAIVVFQPELRRALEKLGEKKFLTSVVPFETSKDRSRFSEDTIDSIVDAAYNMGRVKTGALIVIEQAIRLTEYESTGIHMDCIVSMQVLMNIFEHNTPLHDGAVIIRDSKVYAAGCFLPKPQKEELISKALGSRHRAAIGMSEVSDAVIVVVSEETGTISIAENGSLTRFYNKDTLRKLLTAKLIPEKPEAKKMKGKALKKHKKNAPDAKKEQGADK